jgi:hypothetical protein
LFPIFIGNISKALYIQGDKPSADVARACADALTAAVGKAASNP